MTEAESLLDDLEAMTLTPAEWEDVRAELTGLDASDPGQVRLSQIVFEARVRQRFHAGRASSTLPPTKQTSALPWVGLVCAALLLVVGGMLGGGLVLFGVLVLSLGVFGVALAGSRVAHRRRDEPESEPPVAMPASVRDAVQRLRTH